MMKHLTPRRFYVIGVLAGCTLACLCWLALLLVASLFGLR